MNPTRSNPRNLSRQQQQHPQSKKADSYNYSFEGASQLPPGLQSYKHIEDNSVPPAPPAQSSVSEDSASRSVPTLRFPRPQGSQVLASWISSSSPDIMASLPSPLSSFSSQDESLESPFEIISRDGSDTGSTDERAGSTYEGLSSEDERYPNPDEVRAFGGLNDMCHSITSVATDSSEAATDTDTDEEDEQDEDATRTESFIPAHQDTDAHDFLQEPLGESSVATIFAPTSSTSLPVSSIEFSEPEEVDVHIDKISVKHTIKDFSDEEATRLFLRLSLGSVPEHVSATIRQTMSQSCLSTHEPFRALYLGNAKFKGEIIEKLDRAITCSLVDYNESRSLRGNADGEYNVVHLSSGTVVDRSVYMKASGFQITVDTCIGAEKKALDSRDFRGDIIYSLTVDDGNSAKKYTSIPAPGLHGARVQPAWNFPHVAVFCASEADDNDLTMRDLQRIVLKFCERHAIPTLFISDHPVYAASRAAARWTNNINKDAVHLCLESRDGNFQLRCPIDLNSFLNIDNRQMNQNLAYLTGFQEPDSIINEKMKDVISPDGTELNPPSHVHKVARRIFKFLGLDDMEWLVRDPQKRDMKMDFAASLIAFAFFVATYFLLMHPLLASPRVPAGGNWDELYPGDSRNTAPTIVTTPPSVHTITVERTMTETVVAPPVESASFGGLLSDIAHTVGADWPKNTACSAVKYSDVEILVKISTGTKEKWLAKGAIDIDIFRGDARIPSVLSSSSEGIIIRIPPGEAHGVVNVSVVTTSKPKINETFTVDFGTPLLAEFWEITQGALSGLAKTLSIPADRFAKTFVKKEVYEKDRKGWFITRSQAQKAAQGTSPAWWNDVLVVKQAVQNYSSLMIDGVDGAYHKIMDTVPLDDAATLVNAAKSTLKDALNNAQHTLGVKCRLAEARKNSEMAILKAQISSKLWWLKIQGKDKAYLEYEEKALEFVSKQQKARFGRATPDASAKDKGTGKWQV